MKPVLHRFRNSLGSTAILSLVASLGGTALSAAPAYAAPVSSIRPLNVSPRSVRRMAALQSTTYSNTVLASAPLAYYRLGDTSATMLDSGAQGLNGTYGPGVSLGSPTITSTGDTTPFFNGGTYNLSNFASVSPRVNFQPPVAVSVEGWTSVVEYNRYNTYIPLVAYGRQAQGPAYSVSLSPQNAIYFWVKTLTGSIGVQSKIIMQAGQTHQFACTYDGATLSVYIDGKLDNARPLSGGLNYTNINSMDGLGIGGSNDGTQPVFNGAISEVSLYGRALTPSDVQAHYVAGVKPTLVNEVPAPADSLVDMQSVNTHMHYTQSVYATAFPAVQSLMVGLGIRHMRDALMNTTWQGYYDHLNSLGLAGIKTTLTTDRDLTTAANIIGYPALVPNAIEGFEGPNEQDLNYKSDPQWPQKAQAFQKMLYTTVHGNAATNKYPVLGPSLTSLVAYQAVGDLSAYMDHGNFHEYFSGYNPGTPGWGSHSSYGIYGSIDWNLNSVAITDGAKRPDVTETGYNTQSGVSGNAPVDIQEKYVTRTFLEMYNRGIRRAAVYELVDLGQGFGLVDAALAPKPAYYALMNMNALFADPGPAFSTTPLSFLLSGNMSNVHHLLMQKRDGSYYLAVWIEAPSWIPNQGTGGGGTYITVAPQNVVLQLPAAPRSVSLTSWDTTGSTSTTAVAPASTVSVTVTDNISVVHIVP